MLEINDWLDQTNFSSAFYGCHNDKNPSKYPEIMVEEIRDSAQTYQQVVRISSSQVGQMLKLSPETARRATAQAIERGLLLNEEYRRGCAKKLRLGKVKLGRRGSADILPSVEAVERLWNGRK